jgi:hypothetical protein
MRKQVEAWQRRELTDVNAKVGVWSANRKRALSSALFRRVEVPLALK